MYRLIHHKAPQTPLDLLKFENHCILHYWGIYKENGMRYNAPPRFAPKNCKGGVRGALWWIGRYTEGPCNSTMFRRPTHPEILPGGRRDVHELYGKYWNKLCCSVPQFLLQIVRYGFQWQNNMSYQQILTVFQSSSFLDKMEIQQLKSIPQVVLHLQKKVLFINFFSWVLSDTWKYISWSSPFFFFQCHLNSLR